MKSFHVPGARVAGWILAAAACALLLTSGPIGRVEAATSGTSDVILQALATVELSVTTASVTLSPGQSQYEAGNVSAEGASGIIVQVRTNSSTGMTLAVKCSDAVPEIRLSDLLFKTPTAPGGSGTSISSYTPITASDQVLWSTTNSQETFTDIGTDIRIQNLYHYTDPGSGGRTAYTNTLTYTVAVQ